MKLRGVTITGADDQVDPQALVILSAEFPFVEWGILRSEKRAGTPRYPSQSWRRQLGALVDANWRVQVSEHLCGKLSRDVMSGLTRPWVAESGLHARRVQLNGFNAEQPVWLDSVLDYPIEVILQCRDLSALRRAADIAQGHPNLSALFDPSGGRGLRPTEWPPAPPGLKLGYAGGIGPQNFRSSVAYVTTLGKPSEHGYWLDMESGVRTNDHFDLGKVRQVLEAAEDLVNV